MKRRCREEGDKRGEEYVKGEDEFWGRWREGESVVKREEQRT